MSRSVSVAPDPLRHSEWVVGGLAFITVALTTWAFAGRAEWAPPVFTALSVLTALAALVLTRREGIRLNRAAFAPLLIFALLVTVSVFNLSHSSPPDRPGVWIVREDRLAWLPATVDRATTFAKALPWLSALLLGAALRQTAPGRRAVRLLWGALLGQGVLVAVVGVFFFFSDRAHILGLVRARHGYHFASFAYRNHWTAFTLLLMALALGFAFSALRRWQSERGRLDATLAGLGLALLLALTLPLPGSRSGVVLASLLLLFALVRLAWLFWHARPARHASASKRLARLGGVLALVVAVLAGGYLLSRDTLKPHWVRTQNQLKSLLAGGADLRVELTRDTLKLAADRPVWGWGVGSYGLVFHLYQGDYLRDKSGAVTTRVLHAHNDWAQVAAETGAVGLLLLAIPAGLLLLRAVRHGGTLVRWGAGGLLLVLAYALVDFPLHCPAVLLLWTVLLCTAAPPPAPAAPTARAVTTPATPVPAPSRPN